MLRSLEIRDLVVLRRAEIEPPLGLTAVTGESGVGKTVLAQSLGLLLGGTLGGDAVRPGARGALVQATLELPGGFFDDLEEGHPARAVRELLEAEDEAVVARRFPRDGRARALVDGQAAPRDAVAALVGELIRVSGQGEARRLLLGRAQLEILDSFAGEETVRQARDVRRLRRIVAARARALTAGRERAAGAEREREDLERLVAEVDSVAPDPSEERLLRNERERLRHGARLAAAAGGAADAISGDEAASALDLAGRAATELRGVAGLDGEVEPLARELEELSARLQEAALGVRAYLDSLDAEPGRLDAVEARLEEYERLSRRHGPGTEAVLERAERARAELAQLAERGDEVERLATSHSAALADSRDAAARLRAERETAAPRLAEAASAELHSLAMPRAVLEVSLTEEADDPPRDRCDMTLRVNPGLPAAPLAEAASGGELSRVLLALHSVAAARGRETWVFDEVDAGIGGETAAAVAERLARLAEGRQVLAITHLPQVAALAGAHYRLVKGVDDDGRAEARVEPVPEDALVDELCRMLGARAEDAGARRHAEELLARRIPPKRDRRRRSAA